MSLRSGERFWGSMERWHAMTMEDDCFSSVVEQPGSIQLMVPTQANTPVYMGV